MLFVSAKGLEVAQTIKEKSVGIELRLDFIPSFEIDSIKRFLQDSPCPVMLTLRKGSQGGQFQGTESEREALIEKLLLLEPPYFDLESDMAHEFLERVLKSYPKTKFILSSHYFQETPADLEGIYNSMQEYPAFGYKIAAMTQTTNDGLRMLVLSKKHPKLSAICMGERGGFSRVLGPVVGNLIDYASIDSLEKTAPGQLTVRELFDIYQYPSLNKKSSIYGLIGDPVEMSPGPIYHNGLFRKSGVNSVYVKMVVKPEELHEFIPLAKELGIRGLSVTIPLKEKILPFVDEIDATSKEIGALNTLLIEEGKIMGINTDGHGALDAIEKKLKVHGKKLVLLGAGGAARAIAFEAKKRGAEVLVLNRTAQRAKELAKEIGCKAGGLNEIPAHYDILINSVPELDLKAIKNLNSRVLAMDVVYFPKKTPFLKEAALKNCQVVFGEEMFLNQAARQRAFWKVE